MAIFAREEQRSADRRSEDRRALELDELRAPALEAVVEGHDERKRRPVLVLLKRPLPVGRVARHKEVG